MTFSFHIPARDIGPCLSCNLQYSDPNPNGTWHATIDTEQSSCKPAMGASRIRLIVRTLSAGSGGTELEEEQMVAHGALHILHNLSRDTTVPEVSQHDGAKAAIG